MCDSINGICANRSECRGAPPLEYRGWLYPDSILTDTLTAYVADPGNELRAMRCMICRKPVAGEPFVIHYLTLPDLCPVGMDHLTTMTMARHTRCRRLSDVAMVQIMLDTANAPHDR